MAITYIAERFRLHILYLQAGTPLSLQDRLERVWTLLRMPDNLKLDMAIKYSSETYIESLEEVRNLGTDVFFTRYGGVIEGCPPLTYRNNVHRDLVLNYFRSTGLTALGNCRQIDSGQRSFNYEIGRF